jgi:hypothetical protein
MVSVSMLLGGMPTTEFGETHDHFFAALQEDASGSASADRIAWLQYVFLLQRCLLHAAACKPYLAR